MKYKFLCVGVLSAAIMFFSVIDNVNADSCPASGGSCISAGAACNGTKLTSNIFDCDSGTCCVPGAGTQPSPYGTVPGTTTPTQAIGNGQGIYIPQNTGLPNPSGGVAGVLSNLLSWLLGIVGVLALIGFVVSGIQYILASGDDTMMETAKRNLMYSLIGITVVLASFVIIQAISYALQGSSIF